MALTNAQRQARHRERIKARLAQAHVDRLGTALAAFRSRCAAEVAEAQADPDAGRYGPGDLVLAMSRGARTVAGVQADFLAAVLGVADPWPHLDLDGLHGMIAGRYREAKQREIPVLGPGAQPCDLVTKLVASRNRDWLEAGLAKAA